MAIKKQKTSATAPQKSHLPRLKNYDLIELVGKGGMAKVYKATQKSLNRVVAIKELKESLKEEGNPVKRFEREAIATSMLSHENIVSIYDFFVQDNKSYLVMEYVGGIDLATLIRRYGKLPIDLAVMIILQVVRALEYIHANGMVHRDIKPGNIMLTSTGVVKLMDFGVVQSENWETLTLPGTFVGTPRYMSPEQIKGAAIDYRSDIFSIGIIFYELLTGSQLFSGSDKTEVFYKVTRQPITRPSRVRPGLPWTLTRALQRCLRRDPRRRFPTTQALRRSLENFLGDQKQLTMRQRISRYLLAKRVVAEDTVELSVATSGPQVPKKGLGDILLRWLIGPERYGFGWYSLTTVAVSLILSLLVWWQSPSLPRESAASSVGGLKVVATPWAKVYLDGKLREVTPFDRAIPLSADYHQVVLKHPSFGSRSYEIAGKPQEIITLAIDFRGFNQQESD